MIEEDSGLEVGDGEVFVGRVDLGVGEGEAEEQGIDPKDFAEGLDDRDGAAFADEDR